MALNVAGTMTLLLLAWDGFACRDRLGWRRRGRWLTWLMAAVSQATLFGLYFWMQYLISLGKAGIDDPVFHPVHRVYLWISAAQWAAMLVFTGLMLASWREEDRQAAPAGPTAPPAAAAPPPGTA
jgi:hypothetical protein